jgi:hypothetical protein
LRWTIQRPQAISIPKRSPRIILVVGFGIYIWDFNRRKKLPAKGG